jgi:energy-coupling factor transporter ATP-binding protein EcfA2
VTAALIRRLTLTNFRNYHAAGLSVDERPVVLVGPNGAGKTNLIEAISFLAPGRGLRRATLEEVAFAEGDGAWAVSAEIEGALGLATLGTGIDPPGAEDALLQRQCRIDREPVSVAAFADHLRVVWLAPSMDGLFVGPASERRRFLDRLVLALDAQHAGRVSALQRSLRSRNRLLETPGSTQWNMKPRNLRSPSRRYGRRPCGVCRPLLPRAMIQPPPFPPPGSRWKAGWSRRSLTYPLSRWRTVTDVCSRIIAGAMRRLGARSTVRISPI